VRTRFIPLLLATVLLTAAGWVAMRRLPALAGETSELQGASPTAGWEGQSQVSDAGAVRVRATPVTLGDDATTWDLIVSLDTHSVDLGHDLLQVARLRCDQGIEFQPLAWEGSPAGGHHREGTLRFEPIDHESQYLELVIRDVGQVPERSFRWEPLPTMAPTGS
jgi:hypothetical protein